IFAVAVHHARHPKHDPVSTSLQAPEKLLRFRVSSFIDLEVVIPIAPGAVDQDGAYRQVVPGITFQQFIDVCPGINNILPQPTLQCPGWSKGDPAVTRAVEWDAPERQNIDQINQE